MLLILLFIIWVLIVVFLFSLHWALGLLGILVPIFMIWANTE